MVEKFPATFQYPEHLGNSHMIDRIRLHYDVRSQFGHFHFTVPEVPTHHHSSYHLAIFQADR